jgi:hypothetical protein
MMSIFERDLVGSTQSFECFGPSGVQNLLRSCSAEMRRIYKTLSLGSVNSQTKINKIKYPNQKKWVSLYLFLNLYFQISRICLN